MMFEVLRYLGAVVLTYAASRLLWRVPLGGGGLGRLVRVHVLSALMLGGLFAWLSLAIGPAITVAVAQGCWVLVDLARGRGVLTRGARPARR